MSATFGLSPATPERRPFYLAVIAGLASELIHLLKTRDPLADRVHLSKPQAALIAGRAAASTLLARATSRRGAYQAVRDDAA